MLGTPTLTSLLDRQTHILRTQLDGVYDGGVDAVHDARVATRRIRELLALVPPVPGREGEDETAAGYKKMGRALGKVRDVDVQIALIRNLEDHAPQTGPSLLLVRQRHEADRMTRTRSLVKTLERIDVDGLLNAVANGHPAGLRRRLSASGWRQQLRRLLGARAQTAIETIVHATGIYFPRRAHSARIAIKQLRYAVEIAQATGRSELEPAGKVLRKGQEVLGDLHDRQELADTLAGYGKGDGVDLDQLRLARQVLMCEVMQLHTEYLGRRTALRAACAEIDHAAARAWRPGPAAAVGAVVAVSGLVFGSRMLAGRAEGA